MKIKEAFRDMRQKGLVALMKFGTCCKTCETQQIVEEVIKRKDGGANPMGSAYTSRREERARNNGENFMIYYGQVESPYSNWKTELSDGEVAKIICESLEKYGISYEWNGNPRRAIEIINYQTPEVKTEETKK